MVSLKFYKATKQQYDKIQQQYNAIKQQYDNAKKDFDKVIKDVKWIQERLNYHGFTCTVDGSLGTHTDKQIKAFQKAKKLIVDGIVGKKTIAELEQEKINQNIKELQAILNQIGINIGEVNGVENDKTKKGIREFQKIFGLVVDGVAGKNTWAVLNKAKEIKNFKVQEFACKHCKSIKIDINLLVKLEELRQAIGSKPIIINSGYRCPTHNRNVGGAKNSQHLYGKAADVRVAGMSPRQLEKYADRVFSNGGVGMGGATIVHVDTRNGKARWRYN